MKRQISNELWISFDIFFAPRCFERFIWPPYETTTDVGAYVHVTKRFLHGLPGHWRSWPVLYIWDGSSSSWRHLDPPKGWRYWCHDKKINASRLRFSFLANMMLLWVGSIEVSGRFSFYLCLQSWPVKRSLKVVKWASVHTTHTSKVHILFLFTTYPDQFCAFPCCFVEKNKTVPWGQKMDGPMDEWTQGCLYWNRVD